MSWIWEILGLILFVVIIIRARVKKRGYFIKDKQGNQLKFKEFTQKWKQGIEGITPLQQTRTTFMGLWITISGIIAGIIVNALVRMQHQWWWIEIILIGSLIITGVQFMGTYQKLSILKKIDKTMKEAGNQKWE
jgi:hypothetical protein